MSESNDKPAQPERTESDADPILGLVGLGKEAWLKLGGGEKILAWLRSDDPDARPPWATEQEGEE